MLGKTENKTLKHVIFLGSKITVDDDYSHEIQRFLLLEREAMTNLNSVLKRRDIILLTKVRIVKAMAFPVVMYGCESWTISTGVQPWLGPEYPKRDGVGD